VEPVVAANRLVECGQSPTSGPVRICAAYQHEAETVEIVPIAFS
jgi:hypothetical protein